MTLSENFLVTNYRFAMSPMYKIGDYRLMADVARLGVTPGLLTYNISKEEIAEFNSAFNTGLILGVNTHTINEDKDKLLSNNSYIQIRRSRNHPVPVKDIIQTIREVQKTNKVIIKNVSPDNIDYWSDLLEIADAFELMDSRGAGNTSNYDYITLARWCRREFPNTPMIATGGVSSRDDIHSRLDSGYSSVLLGTAFALCHECTSIPIETKIKMLGKKEVTRIDGQNLVVLGDTIKDNDKNQNNNYNQALTNSQGMIFGSTVLSQTNGPKIQSLRNLVKSLS
jgi:hypothetical protein